MRASDRQRLIFFFILAPSVLNRLVSSVLHCFFLTRWPRLLEYISGWNRSQIQRLLQGTSLYVYPVHIRSMVDRAFRCFFHACSYTPVVAA